MAHIWYSTTISAHVPTIYSSGIARKAMHVQKNHGKWPCNHKSLNHLTQWCTMYVSCSLRQLLCNSNFTKRRHIECRPRRNPGLENCWRDAQMVHVSGCPTALEPRIGISSENTGVVFHLSTMCCPPVLFVSVCWFIINYIILIPLYKPSDWTSRFDPRRKWTAKWLNAAIAVEGHEARTEPALIAWL